MTEMPVQPTAMPPWIPRLLAMVVAFGLGTWLLIGAARTLRGLLINLLLSFVLSLAMEPLVHRLASRGWKRGVATFVVFLAVGTLGTLAVALVVPALVSQVAALIGAIPGFLADLDATLQREFDVTLELDTLEAALGGAGADLGSLAADLGGRALGVGSTLLGLIFDGLTILLFTFYFVADGPRMRRVLLTPLSAERQTAALDVWEIAMDKTGGYVYSRILLASASAVFTWGALQLIGVPYALALGVFVGLVSQFIPAVGTYIASVVPVLIALTVSVGAAVGVLVALVVYQQIENYLIAPRITARTMQLHPAIAFGATLAGASLLGVVGALIALPVAATIQAVISTTVRHNELVSSWLLEEPAAHVQPGASSD